ncbi:hypothetical protein C7457_0920 [Thermovibrio guaymasensis]|uniref:6-hydroxymethylpterin diphosphokinase MptE-like domain-containing protein n=1 Tax=Thermovibrio guaymasensis TaxID=240167 RepID=A0A420W9N0_9BACT|nr:6-hydroxymethylpterin diphosphokinase MptE-like protein [Thermovibrio guaymasensis]RKQ64030.1 hypothetical protein C7457_0920 [Thermovibrio guaymasensis]
MNPVVLRKNLSLLASFNPAFVKKLSMYIENGSLEGLFLRDEKNDYTLIYKGQRFVNLKQTALGLLDKEDSLGLIHKPFVVEGPVSKILRDLKNKFTTLSMSRKKFVRKLDSLIVLGTFPFFHISNLKKKFPKLEHVIVIEPRPEFIYLFLGLIDLEKILLQIPNFSLYIDFSVAEPKITEIINLRPFSAYFKSYESKELKEIENSLKDIYEKLLLSSLPENIVNAALSLRKNIVNSRNEFLLDVELPAKETKVFFIGSGPSVDKALPLLKEIQKKHLVVALGSAIKPLLMEGVLPDINVAIDPMKNMDKVFLREVTNKGALREVLFFGSPEVDRNYINKFEGGRGFFFGLGRFANMFSLSESISAPLFPSPTVLNFAFDFFVRLGFRKFVLVGVDLGTKIEDRLHSRFYTDFDKYILSERQGKWLKGNFGGEVWAPADFYMSKKVFEEQISFYKEKYPNFYVINTSDGVFIDGTVSITLDEVTSSLENSEKPKEIVLSSFRNYFKSISKMEIQVKRSFKEELNEILLSLNSWQKMLNKFSKKGDLEALVKSFELLMTLASSDFFKFILLDNMAYHVYLILVRYVLLFDMEAKNFFSNLEYKERERLASYIYHSLFSMFQALGKLAKV